MPLIELYSRYDFPSYKTKQTLAQILIEVTVERLGVPRDSINILWKKMGAGDWSLDESTSHESTTPALVSEHTNEPDARIILLLHTWDNQQQETYQNWVVDLTKEISSSLALETNSITSVVRLVPPSLWFNGGVPGSPLTTTEST